MTIQTLKRICHICEAACGLNVTVEVAPAGAGEDALGERLRIIEVRGNPDDVFSHGYVCAKGVSFGELHHDADRLTTPLVRRDGMVQPASWDEAFAFIAGRLKAIRAEHGAQACATYIGNPTAHNVELMVGYSRLGGALGSTHVYTAGSVDQNPKQIACGLLYGNDLSIPVPDIDRTDLLVVMGANPLVSNGSLWMIPNFRAHAVAMQQRGGRMVVIDPHRTQTAKLADTHLFIRPGTDALLLAAVLNVVFAEGLEQTTRHPTLRNVDVLRAAVRDLTPETVAEQCGVAALSIRELARDLANTKRAVVYGRVGTTLQRFGTLTSFLIEAVNIVCGNLDIPGGAMFAQAPAFGANNFGAPGSGQGVTLHRYTSRVSKLPEVLSQLPVAVLAEEIETPGDGQIRALFTIAGNPLLSTPEGARLKRAFATLELLVSVDIYLSETAAMADVVLPGTSPMEHAHYDAFLGTMTYRNAARFSPALLPVPDGQKSEWEILQQLAFVTTHGRVGAAEELRNADDSQVFGQVAAACADPHGVVFGRDPQALMGMLEAEGGVERVIELQLRIGPWGDAFGAKPDGLTLGKLISAPDGIDLGELAPRLPDILKTPGGVIDLAPPMILSEIQRAAQSMSEGRPSLVLVGQRNAQTNNSWLHNLPNLAKGPERCVLGMHPQDAARLGVADGEQVRVSTREPHAALEVAVAINADMMPGVVCLPHGFGHDEGSGWTRARTRPGVNSNLLASTKFLDLPSSTAALNGFAVDVARC